MGTCWQALNSLSIRVTFTAIVQGRTQGGQMCKNVLKWRTFELTCWITGKRLKIHAATRFTKHWIHPLSNSNHVTFTAIVPVAYPGEAKMCKKCAKMAKFWIYGLHYWETVEDRWVHAETRFTSIESSFHFHPCNIYRDCSRGVPMGGQNMP